MEDREWPAVGVVVVNWNNYDDTAACLASLGAVEYPDLHVVVVDNASTDGSGERLAAAFERCEFVFTDENRGFGAGCNAGIEHALAAGVEFVFLLNNDATVEDGLFRELVAVAGDSGAGVVGALVADGSGTAVNPSPSYHPDMFFYSGYRANLPLASDGEAEPAGRWWETDRVEGAGVLLSRDLLAERRDSAGYYLDDSLFMYCEEVELATWCRAHDRTSVVAADAVVRHSDEASSNRAFQLYYLTRNRILIAHRYFASPARVGFDLLYLLTRLALAGRFLKRGDRDVARAIVSGLIDGYRGVDGEQRAP